MRTLIHGFAVELSRDVDHTWKWRTLPNGVWSVPFLTYVDCRRNAAETLEGSDAE